MNKLLVVTVLIAVFALGVESFHVRRQTDEEEESGRVAQLIGKLKNYYDYSVKTIKDLELDRKVKNFYEETKGAVHTYVDIVQDQFYHMIYSSESA
ncbi:apolipoprotein C-II [Neoarius graeffei]|uniref:apolipoprotein C-II n=1 Tax=Neoarius graeffei TaxID=443677 RepID=UPI00298D5DA5|nr:apolipoprotein C-II [Neoarius graeffei]